MSTYIDNLNFANDPRNCGAAEAPVLYLDDGEEVKLPRKWAVCPVCDGKGTHVNPAIDCNGLTSEDFCEDEEFGQAYMDGVYDQQCNSCGGRTTVPAVDWDAMTPGQQKLYEQQLREEADDRAYHLAEIRAGA